MLPSQDFSTWNRMGGGAEADFSKRRRTGLAPLRATRNSFLIMEANH
jgi:hypothetical protein